jgi:DNA-binding GntR family transcriptional regulator
VLRAAAELELVHAANMEFHTAIHHGAHNGFLAEAAWVLRRKLAPLSRAQFGLSGRTDNSAAEHRVLFDAISSQDGPAAEQAMRCHIRGVALAFDRWMEHGRERRRS